MRKQAEFRRAVERLQGECQRLGLELPTATAENILAGVVRDMATRLGVREETVTRTRLGAVDAASLAADLLRAEIAQKREVADASPAVISIESTGRLVASLAQAVRCVSLNHEQLSQEPRDKWDAIGVLDDASNGLTLVGGALERHHTVPHGVAILWNDETVVYARRALSRTVTNIRGGTWSFGHGPELDAEVAARMESDLALLPAE